MDLPLLTWYQSRLLQLRYWLPQLRPVVSPTDIAMPSIGAFQHLLQVKLNPSNYLVTIELDLNAVVNKLKDELGLKEENAGEGETGDTITDEVIQARPS